MAPPGPAPHASLACYRVPLTATTVHSNSVRSQLKLVAEKRCETPLAGCACNVHHLFTICTNISTRVGCTPAAWSIMGSVESLPRVSRPSASLNAALPCRTQPSPRTCQRLPVARPGFSLSLTHTHGEMGGCSLCGGRGGIDQEASPHWLRKAARNDNHSRSFGERSSGSSRRFRSLNTHGIKQTYARPRARTKARTAQACMHTRPRRTHKRIDRRSPLLALV